MKYHYLIVGFVLFAAACGSPEGASDSADDSAGVAEESLPHVETLQLRPTLYEDVIVITGTISAINDASLSAQAAGTVEVLTPLGQRVGAGSPVAQLEDALLQAVKQQAQAQWENANAGLELATDNYERLEPLFEDSIISALEFTQVRTGLRQAEAAVRQTEALLTQSAEQLANTVIAAPFAGTIEQHYVEIGEQVAPGSPVARIVDASRVKVSVGVPERYAGDIELGTEVTLNVAAYNHTARAGSVSFVGSAIDPDSRTFPIEARIDNSDGALKPEMIAEVRIIREQMEDVLVIPRTALVRDEAGTSVFVVTRTENSATAERRHIVPGATYSGLVVIAEGVDAQEEIIIRGQSVISDGDQVLIDYMYAELDESGVPVAGSDSSTDEG